MPFGIDRLTRLINELTPKIEQLLAADSRLERKLEKMATDVELLDAKLDAVDAAETKLGQDIKDVIAAIEQMNVPVSLTAQLAKLDKIGDDLIASDKETLANLPPVSG